MKGRGERQLKMLKLFKCSIERAVGARTALGANEQFEQVQMFSTSSNNMNEGNDLHYVAMLLSSYI